MGFWGFGVEARVRHLVHVDVCLPSREVRPRTLPDLGRIASSVWLRSGTLACLSGSLVDLAPDEHDFIVLTVRTST